MEKGDRYADSESADMELETTELEGEYLSAEKVSMLRLSLEEYREEVYEIERGECALSVRAWQNMIDQNTISCAYISTIDDLLTETKLEDMALASDIFTIIQAIKHL